MSKVSSMVEQIYIGLFGEVTDKGNQNNGFIKNTEDKLKEIIETTEKLRKEKADKTELSDTFKDACLRITATEKWQNIVTRIFWIVLTCIITLSVGAAFAYIILRK